MSGEVLLLSIKPCFAEKIFHGNKRVELRKVRPRVQSGDTVFVYVSSPTKALVGSFRVTRVVEATPKSLWRKVGSRSGITRKEFDGYYDGTPIAYGIEFDSPIEFPRPVPLAVLKDRLHRFSPPQCYQYLRNDESERMLALANE